MMFLTIIMYIIFGIATFCIIWAMGGYHISLKIIDKIYKKKCTKTQDKKLTVTVMIVAHNEEKVINSKLENVIDNDYPKNKIKYIIASDNSNDNTNSIVEAFINSHTDIDMTLYTTQEHMGKTNAQNEAAEFVDTEILIMTDANAMFKKNAISELISSFSDEKISYVCGALIYTNTDNLTAFSESSYWNGELRMRLIESKIKTITAGNGAIYACRMQDYIKIQPIECHDSSWPYIYGIHGRRAIFNEKAIAYEKAGESTEDEYKRKVRMNRVILEHIRNGLKALNIFKYGWFSYFYFGHRTVRYLLWLNHLLVLISSIVLACNNGGIWKSLVLAQVFFYAAGFGGKFTKNKYIHMIYYYCITVVAQWHGVINCIMGKTKSTWESVQSTR